MKIRWKIKYKHTLAFFDPEIMCLFILYWILFPANENVENMLL